MSLFTLVSLLLFWLQVVPRCSSFTPIQLFFDKNRMVHLSCGKSTIHRTWYPSFLRAAEASTAVVSNDPALSELSKKEFSYAAILKVIDESHYHEATKSCAYLASENENKTESTQEVVQRYHSPADPVLSDGTVKALRLAAQKYFDEAGGKYVGASRVDRVELGDLLSIDAGQDPEWKKNLDAALIHDIYPLIRSNWLQRRDESKMRRISANEVKPDPSHSSVLTVTSASVFAGGPFTGAQAALTTLERDAGMFMVHIDLGNDGHIEKGGERLVMGAIYMESLMKNQGSQLNETIVGPLLPGQMVVHKSSERTAAIVVPSNIHDVMVTCESTTLDCITRTEILTAAERARHFALRLVLTTKSCNDIDFIDDNLKDIIEAPSEERSYRLRNYARFLGEGRVRYLTLAGLLDLGDYENHLWLGFDYIARIEHPEYQLDLRQRLSNANKAVFHLDAAAKLCPTDSRVFFQLATAIGAKLECETRLRLEGGKGLTFITEVNEKSNLLRMADALERSAHLESAAIKVGINGVQDLAICLNVLAETWCKVGEFDKVIRALDRWAECGSIRSALSIEDMSALVLKNTPRYEWIKATDELGGKMPRVALKTVGDIPVFEPEDITLLRAAADRHFALAAGVQTSRYTMQYEGNSEVHLDDLCAGNPLLMVKINQILQTKVYPLVRTAFTELARSDGIGPPSGPLCVYDSIFVRYNGDKAKAAGRVGASQPLHQDGGIYSVNIALNGAGFEDLNGDANDICFRGGGTFFEALTVGDGDTIQRPIAPGHAIIHKTTQRHAGAPTTSGVRDILVIFLTARRPRNTRDDEVDSTWRIERAMRLQSIAVGLEREKRICALQLAGDNDPTNSEVSYWLGVHLIQGDMNDPSDERWNELLEGVESLKRSISLNPADARTHYHLGMAISTRHKYAMQTKRAHLLPPAKEAAESLINAFETAIRLERKCDAAGCKNGINLPAALLCLGDFMTRLKNFDKAIEYLSQVEDSIENSGDLDKEWAESMLQEVSTMLNYCKQEATAKSEALFVR